ncbi:hypothetical protein MtrunA17_Chr1g0174971 [Medicago truncatula]|uniref:Uncharacterized protein n=1 Tax=Medicago truncatula TaxID=3880 RepID=A0A396JSD6_MEDTR|nr:hypothetical protein MtrunA17_Chr1g0174971 [Medicago truncatula]
MQWIKQKHKDKRYGEKEQTQTIYTSFSHNTGLVLSPCTSKVSSKRLLIAEAHLQETSLLKVTTNRLPMLKENSKRLLILTRSRYFQCSKIFSMRLLC